MEIVEDDRYDQCQIKLLQDLLINVRDTLAKRDLNIPEEELNALTEEIVFSVGMTIDKADISLEDGKDYVPYLAFALYENLNDESTLILSDAGGSYLHEMVSGSLDEIDEETNA